MSSPFFFMSIFFSIFTAFSALATVASFLLGDWRSFIFVVFTLGLAFLAYRFRRMASKDSIWNA